MAERESGVHAAVLHRAGDVRFERRPIPAPGTGQVLIRVGSVGVCGSDLHYYRDGRAGSSVVSRPTVLGHEFGGEIVAVGSGVPDARVGSRVSIEPGLGCGTCLHCRRDNYNLCERIHFLGCAPTDGALQTHLVVGAEQAFDVPDDVSDDAAALMEPLSVALAAVRKALPVRDETVLVLGAGPIGNLVAQVALAEQAGAVTVVDRNSSRLERLPHATRIDRRTRVDLPQRSVDVVIECTGSAAALAGAMTSVRSGGRVVLVGVGPDVYQFSAADLQEREISVRGCHRYRDTWPRAIQLAASGQVDLDSLVTHRFDLDEAEAAFTLAEREPASLKAVIRVRREVTS